MAFALSIVAMFTKTKVHSARSPGRASGLLKETTDLKVMAHRKVRSRLKVDNNLKENKLHLKLDRLIRLEARCRCGLWRLENNLGRVGADGNLTSWSKDR